MQVRWDEVGTGLRESADLGTLRFGAFPDRLNEFGVMDSCQALTLNGLRHDPQVKADNKYPMPFSHDVGALFRRLASRVRSRDGRDG